MKSDEKAIRTWIATWLRASKAGDLATLLDLLTDDVLFFTPGRPPMTKRDFAAGGGAPPHRFQARVEIGEVSVHGNWAYTWVRLKLALTLSKGDPEIRLAGHTLSVFRKTRGGKWRLARDANLLAPVKK